MKNREKIIIALDVDDLTRATELVTLLKGRVGGFKVGKQLFTAHGPAAVNLIREQGAAVFLDLKFHDIPNTVSRACRAATRLGVAMLTLHTLGGVAMLREAANAVAQCAEAEQLKRPLLLGVTVLTSLREHDLRQLGITMALDELVVHLARQAQDAGLDGVVASPQESARIKQVCGTGFVVVTPGIRPAQAASHDQQRTLTPAAAIRAGADFLVIGRPVTEAADPCYAVEAIIAELQCQ